MNKKKWKIMSVVVGLMILLGYGCNNTFAKRPANKDYDYKNYNELHHNIVFGPTECKMSVNDKNSINFVFQGYGVLEKYYPKIFDPQKKEVMVDYVIWFGNNKNKKIKSLNNKLINVRGSAIGKQRPFSVWKGSASNFTSASGNMFNLDFSKISKKIIMRVEIYVNNQNVGWFEGIELDPPYQFNYNDYYSLLYGIDSNNVEDATEKSISKGKQKMIGELQKSVMESHLYPYTQDNNRYAGIFSKKYIDMIREIYGNNSFLALYDRDGNVVKWIDFNNIQAESLVEELTTDDIEGKTPLVEYPSILKISKIFRKLLGKKAQSFFDKIYEGEYVMLFSGGNNFFIEFDRDNNNWLFFDDNELNQEQMDSLSQIKDQLSTKEWKKFMKQTKQILKSKLGYKRVRFHFPNTVA